MLGILILHLQEMPMRSLPRATQLALFYPPSPRLNWESLPAPIKAQLIQLLARLLREHRTKATANAQRKQVSDE